MTKNYKNNEQIQKEDYTYLFDGTQQGWIVFPTDSAKPAYGTISIEYDGYPVISIEEKRVLKDGEEIPVGNNTYTFNAILQGWHVVIPKLAEEDLPPKYMGYPVLSVERKSHFENGEVNRLNGYLYTFDTTAQGWHVCVEDTTQITYGLVQPELGGYPVLSMGCEENWGGCKQKGAFEGCLNLTFLHKDFIIPSTVTDVSSFFFECQSLATLPDGFFIPEGVLTANFFFGDCQNLVSLPESLVFPEGIIDVSFFFAGCKNLKTLPETFQVSRSVEFASGFFSDCESLVSLPKKFSLPVTVQTAEKFFTGCSSLLIIPKDFCVPEDCEAEEMFEDCDSLECVPPQLRDVKFFSVL